MYSMRVREIEVLPLTKKTHLKQNPFIAREKDLQDSINNLSQVR